MDWRERITVEPGVCHGRACVKGTRVMVAVVLDNLAADQLKSTLSGAGNITANGKVADQEIQISGVGSYKGADLQSDNLTIRISGAGSADVWAKETLVARISGVGSVNYFGDPHIEKEISGAGSINKKGNK